jgi:hypothetical protein
VTAEECAVAILARASEFSGTFPTTRSVIYRRIGVRQQELFSLAATVNPDYYGTEATSDLDENGAIDLADVADPVPAMEQVQRVVIADAGESEVYEAGDRVNLVPLLDPEIEQAPRATLRDRILKQVGTDLAEIVSLTIYYSRVPLALSATSGTTALELPNQFQELLVIDGLRDLVRRALEMPNREAMISLLDKEETPLMERFTKHVAGFSPTTYRFGRDSSR